MNRSTSITKNRSLFAGLALAATLGCSGCQSSTNGQVLPSAHAMSDSVEYFPTGSKFKLEKEAAAMKAYNEQQAGRTAADAQVQQASVAMPPMSMLPPIQPADEGFTVSAD